ncbi:hypothetical protein CUJ84_pRLN1000451 (plasmid) [Rhizobium leguminosarum]|uniref:Uncharacterized protein n=1 Tax=Rhizobium leguminosarum TaxID=384 RepID=A0A2K9ZCE3_RHILE|nr:hypothetical protein CUJ84_pRLN1000451 [Rhizobium leguminosarum]
MIRSLNGRGLFHATSFRLLIAR